MPARRRCGAVASRAGASSPKKDKQGRPAHRYRRPYLDLTLYLMGHPKPVSVSGMACAPKFGPREVRARADGPVGSEDLHRRRLCRRPGEVREWRRALPGVELLCQHRKDVMDTTLLGTNGGASVFPPTIMREESGALTVSHITSLRDI